MLIYREVFMFILCTILVLLVYSIYESKRSRKHTELAIKDLENSLWFMRNYKNYEHVHLDQRLCIDCRSELPSFYYDENYVIVCKCSKCGKEYIAVWK